MHLARPVGRQGAAEMFGKCGVNLPLGDGRPVADVVNARRNRGRKQEDQRRGGIGAVDLIEPAQPVVFDHGLPGQKLSQQHPAIRPVNARQPRHSAARCQNQVFGSPQDSPRFAARLGGASFADHRPVRLRINRGAARENETRGVQRGNEVARSLQINLPVNLGVAPARACAVDHGVERAERGQRGAVADVARENAKRFVLEGLGRCERARNGRHLPSLRLELTGERATQVAAPCHQHALPQAKRRLTRKLAVLGGDHTGQPSPRHSICWASIVSPSKR